jgi:hypothetical protein
MKKLSIAALFSITLAGCMGYVPGQQSYWDAQIKEMCGRDGGGKVFEVVSLNSQQYSLLLNKFGQISPPLESKAGGDVPIVQRFISTYIRRSDPEIRRDELSVIRKSDGKILGLSVYYSRVGGDLISLHPSYFSCPEKPVDIFTAVIRQAGEVK